MAAYALKMQRLTLRGPYRRPGWARVWARRLRGAAPVLLMGVGLLAVATAVWVLASRL